MGFEKWNRNVRNCGDYKTVDSITVCVAGLKNHHPEGHLYNARNVMNHDGYIRLTMVFFAYLK